MLHYKLLITILCILTLSACSNSVYQPIFLCEKPEKLIKGDTYLELIAKFKLNTLRYNFCLKQIEINADTKK